MRSAGLRGGRIRTPVPRQISRQCCSARWDFSRADSVLDACQLRARARTLAEADARRLGGLNDVDLDGEIAAEVETFRRRFEPTALESEADEYRGRLDSSGRGWGG